MKNKINVSELLKDCPKGMELDCYLFNGLEFDHVDTDNENYPIVCRAKDSTGEYYTHTFTRYGWYTSYYDYAKCVIFPKGKTTWEGFQKPFEDGDIVTCKDRCSLIAFIYKERKNVSVVKYHFALYTGGVGTFTDGEICLAESELVFATEEEKAELFDAIKDNGYKWNPETKTLEKIGYQYPKTYEECCGVFEDNFLNVICLSDDEKDLFNNIIKIKRCRDAYWKIAGEQMGLGKPWEPDFLDDEQLKFCLYKSHNEILPGVVCKTDEFLVFPTEEIRDAFDENFKELINKCKELL